MCRQCNENDAVEVVSGEVIDMYGGDFTYRNVYYCRSTDTFYYEMYGAMEGEGTIDEAWEVTMLNEQLERL